MSSSTPAVTTQKPTIKVENDYVIFDSTTKISFERTLRIPDDGKIYPLPPSFGHFPVSRVDDYLDKVPESWKKTGGVFIPMYQREAMWMEFNANSQQPRAVKVAIGKVNAVSGETWTQKLVANKEDYLVIPDQQWLDGINAGNGVIKQFVAMPLGGGYTVEAQVTGKEDVGGIQLIVYQPKPGKFRNTFNPFETPKPTPIPVLPTPTPIPSIPVMPPVFPSIPQHNPFQPVPAPSPFLFSPAMQQSTPPPAQCLFGSAPPAMQQQQQQSMSIPAAASTSVPFSFCDFGAPQPSFSFGASAPITTTTSNFSFSAQPSAPSAGGFSFGATSNSSVPSNSSTGFSFPPSAPSAPRAAPVAHNIQRPAPVAQKAQEMGLAAGGKMKQTIYADKYGVDTWDEENYGRIFIHIVNSAMYEQITGKQPPATPIDASAYTNFGFPWYNVYDEGHSSVGESSILNNVKSVKEIDQLKFAWPQQNDSTVNISGSQVVSFKKEDKSAIRDGDW